MLADISKKNCEDLKIKAKGRQNPCNQESGVCAVWVKV